MYTDIHKKVKIIVKRMHIEDSIKITLIKMSLLTFKTIFLHE